MLWPLWRVVTVKKLIVLPLIQSLSSAAVSAMGLLGDGTP